MSENNQEKQLIIEGKTLLGSLEKQSERVAGRWSAGGGGIAEPVV